MKLLVSGLLFFLCFAVSAQNSSEEKALQEIIEIFFEGFHEKDSVLMKSVVHEDVVMQSIGKDKDGAAVLHKEHFSEFLKSIVSIPEGISYREEIHSYKIRMDGGMANVWTPYSFYMNGNLSHCGVNNFQLFKKDGKWKIIYLIDTRRREDCENN